VLIKESQYHKCALVGFLYETVISLHGKEKDKVFSQLSSIYSKNYFWYAEYAKK
jgi:hypothetical protein